MLSHKFYQQKHIFYVQNVDQNTDSRKTESSHFWSVTLSG